MLAERIWRLVSWHAGVRAPFSSTLHKFSRRYVMAWNNVEVDIQRNGERWLIEQVTRRLHRPGDVYFDVGANKGEWSRILLANAPGCRLFAFEPIPAVYDELRQNVRGEGADIHCLALSNEEGRVAASFDPSHSDLSSLETVGLGSQGGAQSLEIERITGDGFCRKNGIDHIRLLKVDTEGHDLKVLEGFRSMIKGGRIDIIQFEYNYMSIFSRTFLRDYFELLGGRYRIGRLLRGRIEFFDYMMSLDNFMQSNFVAIDRRLEADAELRHLLPVNAG